MLRKDPHAKLMLKCPYCKKASNEYNWSLQTAARFSIGTDTCPTLIMVLIATSKGNQDDFAGYRLVCPNCYHGVNFEELELPSQEEIQAYSDLVGEKYINTWL